MWFNKPFYKHKIITIMKKSTKIWMCLAGVALVALGVMCILYPGSTLLSLAWVFGLMFFLGGCTEMAAWSATRGFIPMSGLMFLSALLQIILGAIMLFHPAPLMMALPFIFAFWLLFEGINLAISSFDFKRVGFRRWWIVCCFGVLAACFGVYCLVNPNVSVETIAWIVGLGIILDGVGNWVKVAAGADFIKTSTGKIAVNATPEATFVMCNAIKAWREKTGEKKCYKPAGGVSTTEEAVQHYTLVKEILGEEWLNNESFRFGASRLANNLLSSIVGKETKYF